MRRTLRFLCSMGDLDGKPSAYYPRFRPRRLVMPVDPNDTHSTKRQGNPMYQKHLAQQRLRRHGERRGALRLSTVPRERTVGDAFRVMLSACEKDRIFDISQNFSTNRMKPLEDLLKSWEAANRRCQESGMLPASSSSNLPVVAPDPLDRPSQRSTMTVRDIDLMWEMLDRTPLNAPVHGVLALRGKALVERTITQTAYAAFPRLRSKHVQQLLHESCGLLPCSRIAKSLGFVDIAGVDGEVGMWRELNTLTARLETARRMAARHLERVEKGVAAQRSWYWRGVLRAAASRLKLFPVEAADLQPRLEWVRHSLYAFVAFLEMSEQSGEIGVCVRPFILEMFCPQLGRFTRTQYLLSAARAIVATGESSHATSGSPEDADTELRRRLRDSMQAALTAFSNMTPDEIDILDNRQHPLNARADRRRDQFESSGGAPATQALVDDTFDAYVVPRHAHEAPPIILSAVITSNALKEAQLILRYAPGIAPELRTAPIDVDQVVRRSVEVHQTNNYASLHDAQQYRQVEYTVCRMYCGLTCVAEGKGETLMEALQSTAQEMVYNYYLRTDTSVASSASENAEDVGATGVSPVTVRAPRLEEEIAF